jgi:hypothetical protein
MDRTEQRFERFAEIRAGNPNASFDEIMERIGEEETEADERAHYRMLAAQDNDRAEQYDAPWAN